jgi:hypothetical protein
MIYAWLLIKNGFRVSKCRFVTLLKDHSKTDASRDYQYPRKPVYVYEFDVTPEKLFKISAFIRNRVEEYAKWIQQGDDAIPPCAPEERWDKPAKYAVKKDGRKTAIRLLDSKEEADQMAANLGKGHYVEYRAGESVKCQSYCLCCGFCNFYQDSVKVKEISAAA